MSDKEKNKSKNNQNKTIICKRCGRERPHAAHGMCNACHVQEYRKKNNYIGKMGICVTCGKDEQIKARKMCKSCYDSWYGKTNKERLYEKKKADKALYPEKHYNWNKNSYWNNLEENHKRWKEYYEANKVELNRKSKARNDKIRLEKLRLEREEFLTSHKEKLKKWCEENNIYSTDEAELIKKYMEYANYEEKKEILLSAIPDMKRVWIIEFLNTVYRDRKYVTKLTFLRHIERLINFLKNKKYDSYSGGWNIVTNQQIEMCQVETGALKDSLRIFFRWLYYRKHIQGKLEDSILPESFANKRNKRRPSHIDDQTLKYLYHRWVTGDCEPLERVLGLLIMVYGLSNNEIRNLKETSFQDCYIIVRKERIAMPKHVQTAVDNYLKHKRLAFPGIKTKYFISSSYTLVEDKPVPSSFISRPFKKLDLDICPSDLRKAMIFFHKKNRNSDPFELGFLFGIQSKSASLY